MKVKDMSFPDLVRAREVINKEIDTRSAAARGILAQLSRIDSKPRGPRLVKTAAKVARKKSSKLPAKYKDPKTGKTWAGRGMRPKWVKEDYAVKAA